MVYIQSKYTSSLHGEVTIPGDKSISHRSLILGSCANGITSINNLLESEDVLATLNALQKLGIKIVKTKDPKITIRPVIFEVFNSNPNPKSQNRCLISHKD